MAFSGEWLCKDEKFWREKIEREERDELKVGKKMRKAGKATEDMRLRNEEKKSTTYEFPMAMTSVACRAVHGALSLACQLAWICCGLHMPSCIPWEPEKYDRECEESNSGTWKVPDHRAFMPLTFLIHQVMMSSLMYGKRLQGGCHDGTRWVGRGILPLSEQRLLLDFTFSLWWHRQQKCSLVNYYLHKK